MRIDKFLSHCTDMSRKEIKELIKKKQIEVSGEIITRPETQVDEASVVTVSGKEISYKEYVYLILNKPEGYVSATEDRVYPTVCDLVKDSYGHFNVAPAGRLDIDTEGLLILTNDGAFAHDITSPKKNVYKRYFARVNKPLCEEDVRAFLKGMEFKDFTSMPAKLEITDNPHEAYVEIAEGKFHQVKRMFERVGKTVEYLKRVAIGGLTLPDNLALGDVWEMTQEEIREKIFDK